MSPRTSTRSRVADPAEAAAPAALGTDREIDLRLARLHLRTGSLGLARAEFEALVGEGPLDAAALADLAEVRWRTGDLPGAGDAAAAHMEEGGSEPRALAIAAEAATAIGRVEEAGRLAVAALGRLDGTIDDLFAGMPRSEVWPDLGDDGRPADRSAPADDVAEPVEHDDGDRPADVAEPALGEIGAPPVEEAGEPGGEDAVEPPWAALAVDGLVGPADHLEAARRALAAERPAAAALRLGIVLRLEPGLAPAVLDVAADRPGPAFDLVRSDAYRIVGHELDAERSLARAGAGLDDEAAGFESPVGGDSGHDAAGPTRPEPADAPTAELWPGLAEADDPDR